MRTNNHINDMALKRHLKKAILLLSGALATISIKAAPYNPTPYTVDNGGEEIAIQHIGDEHYSYYQTTNGYLIDKDDNGTYFYLNEEGHLSATPVRKQHSEAETQMLKQIDTKKVMQAHRQSHPDRHVRPEEGPNQPKAWARGTQDPNGLKRMPSGKNCAGTTLRFPVILVAGSNTKNCNTADMSNQLNQEGYSNNNHKGSVRDYFASASNGQFVPSFDVYSVSVYNALSSYAGNEGQLVKEAIEQLKANYQNFNANQYDSDNDGEIDAVAILYAGTENQANNLGGFQYEMQWEPQGKQRIGNKFFNTFLMLAQMETSYKLSPICNFVHEFSHCLGLKDHYSVRNKPTSFTTQYPGAHAWDVMATGMYNNGGGCPPGYSAFEKEFMGWIKPTTLTTTDGTTMVTPLNTTNQAYKITVDDNECFYIENRQQTGWDASLPSHGMLIWHIDYNETAWFNDEMNDVENHQRVDIVEAGNLPVTSYYDGFEKNHLIDDPYPGSQKVTYFDRFKSWSGKDMGIKLYQITEKDNNIYFTTKEGVEVDTNPIADTTDYWFKLEADLTLSDNYAPLVANVGILFDSLGIANTANDLYTAGSLKLFGLQPDGKLNGDMTAIAPGQWFDAEGNVTNYGNGIIFVEYDLNETEAKIGHYPNKVKAGEEFTIRQMFAYKAKRVYITYKISIKDSIATAVDLLGPTAQTTFEDNKIELRNLKGGKKMLSVCDANGRLIYTDSFYETEKTVALEKTGRNSIVIVTVEGEQQEKLTMKGIIK